MRRHVCCLLNIFTDHVHLAFCARITSTRTARSTTTLIKTCCHWANCADTSDDAGSYGVQFLTVPVCSVIVEYVAA